MNSRIRACAHAALRLFNFAVIIVLFPGCVSTAWYISRHSDRPIEIQHAIKEGRVCEGMRPEEVALAWGKPQEKQKMAVGSQTIDVWNYTEKTSSDGSNMYNLDVPVASVMFSNSVAGLVVFDWMRYDEVMEEAPSSKEMSKQSKKALPDLPAKSIRKVVLPSVTPGVDLSKWPRITVTGIIVGSGSGGALLNGAYVAVGRSISGVALTAVTESGVYLTYQGETILLGKGESAGAVSSGGLFRKRR